LQQTEATTAGAIASDACEAEPAFRAAFEAAFARAEEDEEEVEDAPLETRARSGSMASEAPQGVVFNNAGGIAAVAAAATGFDIFSSSPTTVQG